MATADEILATMSEETTQSVIVIDNDLRTINIPESIKILGVESDDDVLRLHFRMPKMYGEVDLSAFTIRINYMNANEKGDVYAVTDAAVDDDHITFSWLVGRTATEYRGDVQFIVCLKRSENGVVMQEYNTTVATLKVLQGLETGEAIVARYPDVIESMLLRLDALEKGGGTGGSGAAIDDTTPSSTTTYSSEKIEAELNELKEAIEELKQNSTGGSGANIDDTKASTTTTYSSEKIETELDALETRISALEQGGGTGGGTDTPTVHSITYSLTNCASSASVTAVTAGSGYTTTLTADDGYILETPVVTMGGADITGNVWNADAGSITIASVTGDVVISCAGVEPQEATETLTTMKWKVSGWPTFTDNGDGTHAITIAQDLFDDPSATNPYWTLVYPGNIAGGVLSINFNDVKFSSGAIDVVVFAVDQAAENASDCTNNDFEWSGSPTGYSAKKLSADTTLQIPAGLYPFVWIRNNNAVAEDGTSYTNKTFAALFANGDITFTVTGTGAAAATTGLSVDDDHAQNYAVATTSLVTDEAAATTSGIDSAWAAVIEEAKNAWLLEANGNVNKIPLIIHTDQHSKYVSPSYFDFISEIVNWYDVGKVINLGDTAGAWADADADHPLTECTALENYLDAMNSVPYSKRIEVFGNHDNWGSDDNGTIGLTPQNFLYKYFRNIYARRIDNHGNMVIRDDNYNIKYVIVSGFAYDSTLGGYSHYIIPQDSLNWIIAELEKADGYDVILLSHVPLGSGTTTITNPVDGTTNEASVGGVTNKLLTDLWSGRKAKTSGTVTDEYGNSYTFDFTSCDGELLCGLHGHVHDDGYYYIGDLLDVYFDAYYIAPYAFYFVLVDRENRRLNVWKVDNTPKYVNYQIPFDKPIF